MRNKINLSEERLQLVLHDALLNYAFVDSPDKDGVYRGLFIIEGADAARVRKAIEEFAATGEQDMKCRVDIGGKLTDESIELSAKSNYEPRKAYRLGCETKKFYSGAPVDVAINCFFYQYAGRVGVSYGLYAICKNGEGERLNEFNAAATFGGEFIDEKALED